MASSASPNISAVDRLGFTAFLAIALHVMLASTDFLPEDPQPASSTIEITLSRFDDQEAPEKAEFVAATNQLGSGSEQAETEITTTSRSQEQNMLVQESFSPAQQTKVEKQEAKPVVTTRESVRPQSDLFDLPSEAAALEQPKPQKSILERSLEIAQLEASLDNQIRNYAKRPRVTRLTAASTMKAIDARYVEAVVARIERVGKLHFPTDRGGKKLYGKPRVAISIYADGSIKSIEVLQSSGNLVLDSKTKDIVHRAAPFAPFPKEVRKDRDVLELIRTFSYNNKGVNSSF